MKAQKNINKEFEAYYRDVIVISFNSAFYNLEFDQTDTDSAIAGQD